MAVAESRVADYNSTQAVRVGDRIDLAQNPKRVVNKRRWTPVGGLRCCWHPFTESRSLRSSAVSRPAKLWRDDFGSNSSYINAARSFVAARYLHYQELYLRSLPEGEMGTIEIALDEVTHDMAVQEAHMSSVRPGPTSLFVLRAQLVWRISSDDVQKYQITMPTLALLDTSAEFLCAAIDRALPVRLDFLARRVRHFAVILNTDSASSCLRLARVFAQHPGVVFGPACPPIYIIHARCCVHQLSLASQAHLSYMGILNHLFACCVWMRIPRNRADVRDALGRIVNVVVEYERPALSEASEQFKQGVLDLSSWQRHADVVEAHGCFDRIAPLFSEIGEDVDVDDGRGNDSAAGGDPTPLSDESRRRYVKIHNMYRILSGCWLQTTSVVHHCPICCCVSRRECPDACLASLWEGGLGENVPVPAVNRWTKLFGPCYFFEGASSARRAFCGGGKHAWASAGCDYETPAAARCAIVRQGRRATARR